MGEGAKQDGITLVVSSTFRSYDYQKIVYERGNFVPNKKASPQHTLAYVRNSLIEEQCKIHRSERFFTLRESQTSSYLHLQAY